MSKLLELKKQNPSLDISLIDILMEVFPKSKYVDLTINLLKNKILDSINKNELTDYLTDRYNLKSEFLSQKDDFFILNLVKTLDNHFSTNEFKSIIKFAEFNENKLIQNPDLSTYKSFEDIDTQLSIVELKQLGKHFENQIVKVYEDNEWLVIKPLTWESSKKYGSNTRWCTTSNDESEYFYRYSKNGVLIYTLNRKTGYKVACYKDFKNENEISFWNAKDKRIDSLESNLPHNIMEKVRSSLLFSLETNWDLLSVDEQTTILIDMGLNKVGPVNELIQVPEDYGLARIVRID